VWKLKPQEAQIECHHPAKLEGIWAGAEITKDDIINGMRDIRAGAQRDQAGQQLNPLVVN
jgi:hypothetical protein